MKRIISLIITLFSLAIIFPTTASAQVSASSTSKTLKDLSINYTTMLGHEGRSYDELVQELLNNGLSQRDADYYAKADILANQIEQQDINVDADLKNTQMLSDQYSRLNPDELRDRALNLDPSALKTVLSQNDALKFGNADTQDTLKALDNNNYSVTVEYPDGSKFIASSALCKEESGDNELKTNTVVPGPWNDEIAYESYWGACTYTGNWSHNSYWTYSTGVNWARVGDLYGWYYNDPGKYISYNSDTGASAYAGVVTISSESLSNHQNEYSATWGLFLQGYTDVNFHVSSTFKASFLDLGIDLGGGMGWHGYCVHEVSNEGDVFVYAAQFA